MKVISYALFGDVNSFEFPFYLRGIYFNTRMNRLLYPGWITGLHVSAEVYDTHERLIGDLYKIMPFFISPVPPAPKCEAMLWRLLPLYGSATHVICRDADAITTYREAQAVQAWVNSHVGFHGITDDPAHTIPMMGGMCGFKVDTFKELFPEYPTFNDLIGKDNLKDHGSDQNLLMRKIYPKAKSSMMGHFFKGCNEKVMIVRNSVSGEVDGVDRKLWESNLTCRMIGSPGVVDFELLRFFKRFDPNPKFDRFEKQFPEIFYWAR